jgi:hypothetical protein
VRSVEEIEEAAVDGIVDDLRHFDEKSRYSICTMFVNLPLDSPRRFRR